MLNECLSVDRIAQICEDIGLESGVTLHSEKIRAEILDPNDLARY